MKMLLLALLAFANLANAGEGFVADQMPTTASDAAANPAGEARTITQGTCNRPGQAECWDLAILAVEHSQSSLFQGLDKPAANNDERSVRQSDLGPAVWRGLKDGSITSAGPQKYIVMMWNVGEGTPMGTRINNCDEQDRQKGCRHHVTKPISIQEVSGMLKPLNFDPSAGVSNQPDRAYRIESGGFSPIAVSLIFPRSMITSETYILICSEGGNPIYPSKQRNEGLWGGPATNAYLMRERAKGSFAVFTFSPSG